MPITFGFANQSDCAVLAQLSNTASGGTLEFLFDDLIPGKTAIQVETANLERDQYPYTYKNARVARDGDRVVGMALAYPSSYHAITPEMRQFFPEDRLTHMAAFFTSRVENSWYLDTFCVYKRYRRQGIGRTLLELVKTDARQNGFDKLSLITFAENHKALSFYKRIGFSLVRSVPLHKTGPIQYDGGCLLMNCNLTPSSG